MRTVRSARALTATVILSVGLLVPSTPATGVGTFGWGHSPFSVACRGGDGRPVYAHVVVGKMWARNLDDRRHWVTNFKLKVRLIPASSGTGISQTFRTRRYPTSGDLPKNQYVSHQMQANTSGVNPARDWLVDVKLVWNRKTPWRDFTNEYQIGFPACAMS